jgi:hypothetical protein
MIYIQVKADRDPRVLADLIAATQSGAVVDPKLAVEAHFLRAVQEQNEQSRPARDELETVDFQRLDDENDWTDV